MASHYLDESMSGFLSTPVSQFGSQSVDGSCRQLAMNQLDALSFRVLREAMLRHGNPKSASLIWQFDKLSQAWLGALPGPLTSIPGQEFQQSMAWRLDLPSPACSSIVGQRVGKEGAVVDSFGRSVMCAQSPFDS